MIRPRASALFVAWNVASTLAFPLVRRLEEEGGVSFQYQGNNGPNLWPGFCQDINPGQSPIDIRPGSADANSGALQATLQPLTGVKLQNSGHGLEFILPEGGPDSSFVAAGQAEVFTITGFHIHCPSEHRYEGKYFDAEVHFVGASPSGKTSVMAVMFEVSEQPLADNLMSVVAKQLPLNGKKTVDLPPFDLSSIQVATGNLTGFHSYVGSLTTPPCTTGVLWNVIDKPVPISIGEMLAVRREQGFTSRFVQVARDELAIFNAPVRPSAEARSALENIASVELPVGNTPAGDMIPDVGNAESIHNAESVAPSAPSGLISSAGGEPGYSEKTAHFAESECAACKFDTPEYDPYGKEVSHEAWSGEQPSDCNQDDAELSSSRDLSESAEAKIGTTIQAVSAEPETAGEFQADASAEEVAKSPDTSAGPAATASLESEAVFNEAAPVKGDSAEAVLAEPAPEAGPSEAATAESPAEADAAEAAPAAIAEPFGNAIGVSAAPEVNPAAAAPPEAAAIEFVPTEISPPEAPPAEADLADAAAAEAVPPSAAAPPEAADVQAEQVESAPVKVVPPNAAPAGPPGPAPAEAAPAELGTNAAAHAQALTTSSSPAKAGSEASPVEVVSAAAPV